MSLLSALRSPADLKALSVEQLPQLAEELRQAILAQVSQSGGHLAPNLGVVELTIALHYVFDFGPEQDEADAVEGVKGGDRLLFDVGHQSYVHKLLTGRMPLLSKLRQRDGMTGFPEPKESPFDLFSVGHAGTAISTAVGLAVGDQVQGRDDRKSVALVGDASIVNGLSLEGLNHAGTLKRQFLVVLNDNGMSIAKPQGGMAHMFDRIRVSHTYTDFKRAGHKVLNAVPGGMLIERGYHAVTEALKAIFETQHPFAHFGLVCAGPVDGHDFPRLIEILKEVRDLDRPVLLHVKTRKGKGVAFAEEDATRFHSPGAFVCEGCKVEIPSSGRSFTEAYADAMKELMSEDDKMVAVTAAMLDGTGLNCVQQEYPQRVWDVGICESHAMDMCAGMAKSGLKPFFAVYSTFAQRTVDQLFQEVSLQGLPVRVCMDRGGYVGGDGAVHHGFMDIAMVRPLPNVVALACCDEPSLKNALRFMRDNDSQSTLLRYPRDNVRAPLASSDKPFVLGRAELAYLADDTQPPEVAVLAYGTTVHPAVEAAQLLQQEGKRIAVYDARFAQPVDVELFSALAAQGIPLLTVEDHAVAGGFGANVLESFNQAGVVAEVSRMGHAPEWVGPDSRSAQLAHAGLDVAGITARLRELLED